MFDALKQASAIGLGVLAYDFLLKGANGVDWKRAPFITIFSFLMIVLFQNRKAKTA